MKKIKNSVLHPELARHGAFLLYRYRFLISYILIGFASIGLEIVLYRGLASLGLPRLAAVGVGLSAGMLFAYWMNVRFNFKVPRVKRTRAFRWFFLISLASAAINFAFRKQMQDWGWGYELSRFVVAGTFFLLGYICHCHFSFRDHKKVGVAIYANGIEDIRGIYNKIGAYPDFIHVDIIDTSFGETVASPASYRLEVIRAYWPDKEIAAHIMSREPTAWLRQVAPFVDTIFVQAEMSESVESVLCLIRAEGKRAGLCITMQTPLETIRPWLPLMDTLMLLTIPIPGKSGQTFDLSALTRIEAINRWPERARITVCVDGGVNEQNVGLLNVEKIVSGSSVLSAPSPTRQIMRLQTCCAYEAL
jgi:ribulose-phosphate 3-epimerase